MATAYTYMIYGSYIVISGTDDGSTYVKPETSLSLKLFYSRVPSPMTADTDTPEFNAMYHTALADYAVFKLTKSPNHKVSYDMMVKSARANKSSGSKRIKQTFF